MESVRVLCPKCRVELRLQDKDLLGRRGQCPQCRYRFVLEEPDEAELEMARASLGASGQLSVDSPSAVSYAGQQTPLPSPPAQPEIDFIEIPAAQTPAVQSSDPQLSVPVTPASEATVVDFSAITDVDQKAGGVGRPGRIRRRTAKRRNTEIIAGIFVALAVVLAVVFFAGAGAFSGSNDSQSSQERTNTSRGVP